MRFSSSTALSIVFSIIGIGAVIGIVFVLLKGDTLSTLSNAHPAQQPTTSSSGTLAISSDPYGFPDYNIAFMYSSDYFPIATTSEAHGALAGVAFALDTQENRNLNLPMAPPREGPPTISLSIYANPDRLSPDAWTLAHATTSNYNIRKAPGRLLPAAVAAHDVYQYDWSGLYEGESDVMVNGPYAYVWSMQYQSADDPIINVFRDMLSTVTFSISSTEDPSLR